jgi:hypothetical protein
MGRARPLSPQARGRLGGLTSAARYGGEAMTAAARAAYRESFKYGHECRVCPPVIPPDGLSEFERARRAEFLRRAHFSRLAALAAERRSA